MQFITREGMVLRSMEFLWRYGKLKALMEDSWASLKPQLSEEEREIEELIDSIKTCKKKV